MTIVMSTSKIWAISAATGVFALAACGRGAQDRTPTPAEQPSGTASTASAQQAAPPPQQQPPAQAGPVIAESSFELRATAPGPFHTGQLGRFGISLTPRGHYHVNRDFPMKVTVTAPSGVTVPKNVLERADAAELSEQRARFDVPFTPSAAGDHRVQARVEFAVCTPENCVPDERTLALVLPVQ